VRITVCETNQPRKSRKIKFESVLLFGSENRTSTKTAREPRASGGAHRYFVSSWSGRRKGDPSSLHLSEVSALRRDPNVVAIFQQRGPDRPFFRYELPHTRLPQAHDAWPRAPPVPGGSRFKRFRKNIILQLSLEKKSSA